MTNKALASAEVYYNGKLAGLLEKEDNRYRFLYDKEYISEKGHRPISITMPFRDESYESDSLFPVFTNMLSEGANKAIQCRMLKIDENDYFSLLLATAEEDNIGPITVKEKR